MTDFSRLPKDDRNQHVQVCGRREIASKGHFLQSDVHYCHLCFDWVVGQGVWDSHCQTHLQKLPSKQCGTITYCHTLVRAGYCPFCLGDAAEQSAGRRLESWRRDHALWKHIETHLERRRWPLVCPHPLCDTRLSHRKDLQFHFVDEHGLSRTRPKERDDPTTPSSSPTKKSSPKRKSAGDGGELFCASPKQFSPSNPPKRICRNLSTISPSLLSDPDYDVKYLPPAYTGLTEPPPAAVAEPPPPRDGGETCWSVDQVDLDHMSPVELWSCDSTLIDSPPYMTTASFRNSCVHLHRTACLFQQTQSRGPSMHLTQICFQATPTRTGSLGTIRNPVIHEKPATRYVFIFKSSHPRQPLLCAVPLPRASNREHGAHEGRSLPADDELHPLVGN